MKFVHICMAAISVTAAAYAQTPTIADGGVANAASFDRGTGVAPGSMVAIYGSSLASALARSDSVPLSTAVTDVTVTFNGIAAPVQLVSPNMITAQVPWDVLADPASAGSAAVVVTRPGIQSQAMTIPIVPAAPAIYRVHPSTPQALALNADGTLAAAAGTVEGMQSHPAVPGDTILVYANGLGAVSPAIATGANARDLTRITQIVPNVLIQGLPATVAFSGLSPKIPGLNLLNVTVPAGVTASDSAPIQIQIGNILTTDQITIAVRPQ